MIGAHGSGAMIDMATYIDGDAKWYFTDVAVHPYASYQYSVKYTSTVPAKLTLRYTRGSGSYIYTEIAQLSPSTTWTGASVHFTIPADAVTLTVFHQLAATGSLVIDEASLVPLVDAFTGTPFASGMVTFSFDDGWRSQMINAVGVLDNSHIHGTFGIVTNEMQNADLHAS